MKSKLILLLFAILTCSIGCKEKMAGPVETEAKKELKQGKAFTNVDIDGAKKMIANNPNLIILDVRTPGETKDGMIENAIEIDFMADTFDGKIDKLDKSKEYLVYCKSGGRSAKASTKMLKKGFSNVTNMEGGYSSWK